MQALEMWLWGEVKKISWNDKISNEKVLERVNETNCLVTTIIQRKNNWIWHVEIRGDGLLRDVLEGRMLERKRRGKPREY